MDAAIQIRGLRKSYGEHQVLKGVDLDIFKGEIFSLLGVNGAGKTTMLECIEGLKGYDEIRVHIDGRIGIQMQQSSLPDHIKPMEALRLFSLWNKKEIDVSIIEALNIKEIRTKQYWQLSTGQKRRLVIAISLVGDPDIIFLDEPTAALDVEGKEALHNLMRHLKEQGKTIVLTSHDMSEVEDLCDRIAVLNNGQIIFCGRQDQLKDKIGRKYLINIKTDKGSRMLETDDIADTLFEVLTQLKREKLQIIDIKIDRGNLQQDFIEMTRRI